MKQTTAVFFSLLVFLGTAWAAGDFSSLLQAARQGDTEAMCDVGQAYFYGTGTLKDPFKAKCWIEKAYSLGSGRAEKIWNDLELWQFSGKCGLDFDEEVRPRLAKGDSYMDPVTRMRFVWLPRGCYEMGCHPEARDCRKIEKPSHTVCLDGFWISIHEVSQAVWEQVTGTNPSRFSGRAGLPVENVSFHEVQDFIHTLNRRSADRFSLPTEAQWEYACRSGGKSDNSPWPESGRRPRANCGGCDTGGVTARTAPGGSFPPNDVGLYDMGGNVKEWCLDYYDKKAYETHDRNNPEHRVRSAMQVVRGGSFMDNPKKLRCTARDKSIPTMRANDLGFRLVLKRSSN